MFFSCVTEQAHSGRVTPPFLKLAEDNLDITAVYYQMDRLVARATFSGQDACCLPDRGNVKLLFAQYHRSWYHLLLTITLRIGGHPTIRQTFGKVTEWEMSKITMQLLVATFLFYAFYLWRSQWHKHHFYFRRFTYGVVYSLNYTQKCIFTAQCLQSLKQGWDGEIRPAEPFDLAHEVNEKFSFENSLKQTFLTLMYWVFRWYKIILSLRNID